MKYTLLFFALLLSVINLSAQTAIGLVAYYPFDGDYQDATGNTANTGIVEGSPDFRCGVEGQALLLDGASDKVYIPDGNNINSEFDTEDFSISFYFKPIGQNGQQFLLSKRDSSCTGDYDFFIKYVPVSRTVNALLREIPQKATSLVHSIENTACWQHLVLVRDDSRTKLYINTQLVSDLGAQTRIDISNIGGLTIGNALCQGANEVPFHGLIDELRIYNRVLEDNDIESLFFAPDQILSPDTLIFLGSTVDIELTNTCATTFNWTPNSVDISSAFEAEPSITPSVATVFTYEVSFSDNISTCVATDNVEISVIDPDLLECDIVYLPKAFTPNNDGLNDSYGISNPFSIQELLSFEIFDRWGNRLFSTTDAFQQWDGTYKGQAVDPGVMLYKISHICNDVERVATGSITILR